MARRSGANTLSAGAHWDRFTLSSNRYATTDWIAGSAGALNLQSRGQDADGGVLGAGCLDDRAAADADGRRALRMVARVRWGQFLRPRPPSRRSSRRCSAAKFSPKATLAWTFAKGWTARASFGEAWRFPTVGELYQIVTTPVAAVPNPNLRPEHARSEELAIERADAKGSLRLSLFNEIVTDALISQTGPLNGGPTLATFVQNVDRTRARGVGTGVRAHRPDPRASTCRAA